ncbi:MAG: recombinase family protein, partial [Clostridia bacterium]
MTIIAAKPAEQTKAVTRQLRVAAYCRVSTDQDEQLTSYEAQKQFYTDLIMQKKEWTMAGVLADEGITGTSAKKRPQFLKLIRMCKRGQVDVVLTKSISRFARNTVDCLKYVRLLQELGVAVIFEKENINTLHMEGELMITIMGAFAQAESESISANVSWGKKNSLKNG